jgi:hypothetical protein
VKEGWNLHILHLVSSVAIFLISQDGGKRVIDAAPSLLPSPLHRTNHARATITVTNRGGGGVGGSATSVKFVDNVVDCVRRN